jgi:hypothetical protein
MKRKDSGNIMKIKYKPHPETNEEVWHECLRMWRWIAIEKIFGSKASVYDLKMQWLEVNNYNTNISQCFFCYYTRTEILTCLTCPAKLIDSKFSCHSAKYSYSFHPIRFYLKIRKLNPYKSLFHWLKF